MSEHPSATPAATPTEPSAVASADTPAVASTEPSVIPPHLPLDTLDFAKGNGLVTVVTQDADSGAVLMVAHADREALEHTLRTGEMHYRSRTRGLWHKGGTSGNVLGRSGGEVHGFLNERRTRLRPRVRLVRLVHGDRVAVLGNDARTHLVERVATLAAPGLKLVAAARDHGNSLQISHGSGSA